MRYGTLAEIGDFIEDGIQRIKNIKQAHPSLSGDIAGDIHSAVLALERAQEKLDYQLGSTYRKERDSAT